MTLLYALVEKGKNRSMSGHHFLKQKTIHFVSCVSKIDFGERIRGAKSTVGIGKTW